MDDLDPVSEQDIRDERSKIIQAYKDGTHLSGEMEKLHQKVKDDRTWQDLLEYVIRKQMDLGRPCERNEQSFLQVRLMTELLQCGKWHPKVAKLVSDHATLSNVIQISSFSKVNDFFMVMRLMMLFMARHVPDQFIALIVHDDNKHYLPGAFVVGDQEGIELVDALIQADTKTGFIFQTLFDFLFQRLTAGGMTQSFNFDSENRMQLIDRLQLIISLTEAKSSLVRLVIPRHEDTFWRHIEDCFVHKSKVREIEWKNKHRFLDLCFSLLRLETTKTSQEKSPAQRFVIAMIERDYLYEIINKSKPKVKYLQPEVKYREQYLAHVIELLHLVFETNLPICFIQKLSGRYFPGLFSLLEEQAKCFINYLESPGSDLEQVEGLTPFGISFVFFCHFLKKVATYTVPSGEFNFKSHFHTFVKMCDAIKPYLLASSDSSPLPRFLFDSASWLFEIYISFLGPLKKRIDSGEIVYNMGRTMDLLTMGIDVLKLKLEQKNKMRRSLSIELKGSKTPAGPSIPLKFTSLSSREHVSPSRGRVSPRASQQTFVSATPPRKEEDIQRDIDALQEKMAREKKIKEIQEKLDRLEKGGD